MNYKSIKTLGELKKSGYKVLPIKDEMRKNLILSLKNDQKSFDGILGYDTDSVNTCVGIAVVYGYTSRCLPAIDLANSVGA